MAIFRGIGGAGDSTTDATVTAVTEQAVNAATSATQAASSASSAASSASSASTSATNAAASASTASDAATAAQTAQTNAETAETNAETAQTAAEAAQTAAETAETNAETAETNAETAEANAVTAKNSAEAAQTAAETAETNAETAYANTLAIFGDAQDVQDAVDNAETAYANTLAIFGDAQDVQDAVDSASASAATATTKASEASASASNASTSETNSANSASSANTSATNASNSATAASTSASNASTSETNASNSASTATTKASEASASASAALTSETNAATSESNASTSETNAANSASAASTSATNASNSASAASTSETNAASSATAASNSATSASNSATAANNSASAAATSATNAENAYDSFDDRYLGVKASDPALDNDGAALLTGALYFNSTDNEMRVYTGSVWIAVVDLAGNVTVTSLTASSVDINGGTIDGVTIGGASAGAITGTTITGTSFVSSGDMTFGDDDKAIFGAGSDLQIYHNGAKSFIKDTGTGALVLDTDGDSVRISHSDNAEEMARFTKNGSVLLKYDGADKLETTSSGVDVTGTVTADGLTVNNAVATITNADVDNGATLRLDNSAVSSAWGLGKIVGTLEYYLSADPSTLEPVRAKIELEQNTVGSSYPSGVDLNFYTTAIATISKNMTIASTGDISFYEDTGTTPKLVWDASAESLGIGTASPARSLSIGTPASSGGQLFFQDTGNDSYGNAAGFNTNSNGDKIIIYNDGTSYDSRIGVGANSNFWLKSISSTGTTAAVQFIVGNNANNGERFRVGALETVVNEPSNDYDFRVESNTNTHALFVDAGNSRVGIGTASPASALDVSGTVTADGLTVDGGGTFQGSSTQIDLIETDIADNNTRLRQTVGDFFIQTVSDDKATIVGRLNLDHATGDISFYNDTGTSQNFFWDASTSRLGLGTTSPATTLDVTGTITADKLLLGASTLRSNFFNTTISPASQFEGVGSSSTSSRFISQTYGNSGAIGPIFTFAKHRSTALGGTTVVVSGDELGQLVFQGSDGTQFVEAASIRAGVDGTPGADDMPGALFFSTTADGGSVATERMRIDSSGNVGIGTTSPSSSLQVDRASTDGAIVTFSKDGATVGFIGTNTGQIYIGRDDTGIRFTSGDDAILPVSANSGVLRSGAIDLGRSYSTFRNLYLSGGVYLGGTGSANLLNDYEEGTFTADIKDSNDNLAKITVGTGKYTKIGNVVTVTVSAFVNSVSQTFTGYPYIDFPFAVANGRDTQCSVAYLQGVGTAQTLFVSSDERIKFATDTVNPSGNIATGVTFSGNLRCYFQVTLIHN